MFYQPRSTLEALQIKRRFKEAAMFIAGGTDLVVLMNQGKIRPMHLIDLSHVPELRSARASNGTLEIGANTTYSQCEALPVACLADASRSIGGPGIRELGTLAGNLATASPAGDGATALLALDARIELCSASGSRLLDLADFFQGYRRTALAHDEMISKIMIPVTYRSAWLKAGKRGAMNISIVAVAVAITPEKRVRIALASVAPTPMRCKNAEACLIHSGLNPASIAEAVKIVRREIQPISDHRAGADYKVHLAGVMVQRLLEKLVMEAN